jgi:hypothetical protein
MEIACPLREPECVESVARWNSRSSDEQPDQYIQAGEAPFNDSRKFFDLDLAHDVLVSRS